MKNIQDIYTVTKAIDEVVSNPALLTEIQNLTRVRASIANQTVPTTVNATNINNIQKILSTIDTGLWTNEHWEVAKIMGIDKLLGDKGTRYFNQIKAEFISNPANKSTIITQLTTELNIIRTKPKQFFNLLNDFEINTNIETISEEEGIIEITFEGKVEIEDFKEAKDQMNDWFLIIEGYSRLLNVPRQEFEIINISKNSPTTIKLKTSLKNVTLVLGVVTSLLVIQRSYLDNQLLIEKLRKTTLSPDAEEQRQFVENAEKHIKTEIDAKIEYLVDKKLSEHDVQNNAGDIKTVLSKGIENQYNFINNGGNINVYITNGDLKPQIEKLQNTKEEIKNIRTAYENQKSINSGDTEGQEKLDLD
jgi:hypothetical protein